MVVMRMVDEIRIVDFASLPEVEFAQEPAFHKNRQGAVNGSAAHRPFDSPRHVEQFVGREVTVRPERRLDNRVALRGLAKSLAGKELADLVAHDLFHDGGAPGAPTADTPPRPSAGQGPRGRRRKILPRPAMLGHSPAMPAPADREALKKQAAVYAVRFVEPGMTVGLGTGSTAIHAVREIARRHLAGELPGIKTFATSEDIARVALEAGLPLIENAGPPALDVTIDGADEVDPQLDLIKGGGGALLHEKIVAQATKRQIIVVDEAKLSPQLGTLHALPVEVIPFGAESQRLFLERLGGRPVLRKGADGSAFLTDEGNIIYDCTFGPIAEPEELAAELGARTGIVEHGLFLGLTDDLVIGAPEGLRLLHRDRGTGEIRETAVP